MNKILIVFAHPALEKSRVHINMIKAIEGQHHIRLHDLYEEYPDFNIDIKKEQNLLTNHDIIVWQHPFYWYSGPALLKQWIDLVLEHGWAYGRQGNALKGKIVFNTVSSGGGEDVYKVSGLQGATLQELLKPFERTAALCHMHYLPPFWVPGSHRLNDQQISDYALQFKNLLLHLRDNDIDFQQFTSRTYLNDVPTFTLNQ